MIAFVGSVFSPYYARARRRGAARALDHCAVNVALASAGRRWWTMTERGSAQVERSARRLAIGPSALELDGTTLTFELDEIAVPWPRRVRGRVRLRAPGWFDGWYALDAAGRHRWCPFAPRVEVEVSFDAPVLRWRGSGYFDANRGLVPLEDDVAGWDWSRARLPDGGTAVVYDVRCRAAPPHTLALRFGAEGGIRAFAPAPRTQLPATRWGIARQVPCDRAPALVTPAQPSGRAAPLRSAPGNAAAATCTPASAATSPAASRDAARLLRTLEDGPFYARSLVAAHWLGAPVTAVHESLSLDRFAQRWVQALLPFRMPRRPG